MLWDAINHKIFLSCFTDAQMKADSKGTYARVEDYWRFKTYVKDEEKMVHPRLRDFEEPYQVASKYCDGNWNDFNTPFIIQVGQCNLKCIWCFVSDDLRNCNKGKQFNAKEIVHQWCSRAKKGVFRISGGEPFLAPDFITEVANAIHVESSKDGTKKGRYLWIDTNLLGTGYDKVIADLDRTMPYGITGCFKGFDAEDFAFNTGNQFGKNSEKMLQIQYENAMLILKTMRKHGLGELFFYIPEITQPMSTDDASKKVNYFMTKLSKEIHGLAPLRVTVLRIKEYESNKHRMPEKRLESGVTKKLYLDALVKTYGVDMTWLPQYMIDIKIGGNIE